MFSLCVCVCVCLCVCVCVCVFCIFFVLQCHFLLRSASSVDKSSLDSRHCQTRLFYFPVYYFSPYKKHCDVSSGRAPFSPDSRNDFDKNEYLYWIRHLNISIWNRHSCEQIRNHIYAFLKVLLGFCNFFKIDNMQPVLGTAATEGGGIFHIFIPALLKKNLFLSRSYVVHWSGRRAQHALLNILCFCCLLFVARIRS